MIYHQAIFHRYGDPMALLLKKTGHKFTRKPSCFCGKYSPQRCERWKDDSSIPRKRQRTEPYCIIHCTDDNTTLISPNSLDSWKTLQKAGEIRDHEGIQFLVYRLLMTKSRMEYFTIANVEARLHINMT